MRIKSILFCLLACFALAGLAQPVQQTPEWEWYLDEVVGETFVGRNYFEYYYTPSAADMEQQRAKGEVSYFLNSPEGLNSKKVRDMIDRLMASYDDIKAVGEWHVTTTTYWRDFRFEKNKFRFSIKRKALDDGTYYVSVTETADYFKSLGKKGKQADEPKSRPVKKDGASRRSTRDRKPVVIDDETGTEEVVDETGTDEEVESLGVEKPQPESLISEKQQRKLDAERRDAERRELRAKQRREEETRRAEAKAQKEAEKLKKAEEKKQRQAEARLKKEEQRRQREQEREQARQERAAKQRQAELDRKPKTAPAVSSNYHFSDVALWLSEKYDFTQTQGSDNSCTMFSTMVKDTEMAKLAIKNALKGSNARMAVPWRLNSETQAVETGYTVDDHVLVFTIGKNGEGNITLTITEVSAEQFELFKQGLYP